MLKARRTGGSVSYGLWRGQPCQTRAPESIIRNAGILVAMIMVMTVVDLIPWFIKSPVLWGGLDLPLWSVSASTRSLSF